MDTFPVIVIIVSALLVLCSTQQRDNYVNVTTSLGTVTGLRVVTGNIAYFSFRGIPYANGTTRFKAPTPMQPWASLVMATNDGPQCAQPSVFGWPLQTPVEDCLFLNVYTPHLPQSGSTEQPKLPVMVFIHGGGFIGGSSSSQWYGPEFFMAEKNIILVTFNYRLGIFGFLSTGTQDAQGNAGMKDQVEALKFVKNQISYFGGDADSVTLFGESAGSGSVVHHVLSPMSKGLFQRAIAQSGSALADWANIDSRTALYHATVVARNLGCDAQNATTIVKCLSEMSASALCNASIFILSEQDTIGYLSYLSFVPTPETKFDEEVFLADHPVNVLNKMTTAVPLIIGTNKDEGIFVIPDNDNGFAIIDRNLSNFAPREVRNHATQDQLNAIAQQVRKYYFNNGPVNKTTLEGVVNLFTDQMFVYSTAQTVRKLVEKNSTVYLYHFAYSGHYRPNNNRMGYNGVTHGEDLGYMFYSSVFNNTGSTQTTTDYHILQRMVKLWIAFARTGTPSSSTDEVIKNIQWPQITNASDLNYLKMETNFTGAVDYYKERIALWDQLVKLQSSSASNIIPIILLAIFSLTLTFNLFKFSI